MLRDTAVARLAPAAWLGADYADVLVPAIPSLDYTASEGMQKTDCKDLPPPLRRPLIKLKQTGPTSTQGVASGVRSALIQSGSEWFRLKGCGNNYEGFPIKPVELAPKLRNIRGCCFEHTALRELQLTTLINGLLQAKGFPIANAPLGE